MSYYFAIDEKVLEKSAQVLGVRGLLDMLRYDQAKVLGVEHGFYIFTSERRPTIARWASFDYYIEHVIETHSYYSYMDVIRSECRGENCLLG